MGYRTRISLDGVWDFAFDPENHHEPAEAVSAVEWREAVVPMPWQAQFEDLHNASGMGWYRRMISVDEALGDTMILCFDAVNYIARVWLNGQKVGDHEGGYLPFEVNITQACHPGENELVVQVIDPGEDRDLWPDFPFSEIPHGKQSWYMPVGGIWQSVWLEYRPVKHLCSLRLTPDLATGEIAVVAATSNAAQEGESVQVRVLDANGSELERGVIFPNQEEKVRIDPTAVRQWSPDSPVLYTVVAALVENGKVVDEISANCGFRTVEIRDKRIYINGQPIYLRSALDQAYYPETVYTTPSTEYLEDQARKAKELGLNCLRTHIKVEDPRYYDVADRFGLLIWTEIPNWVYLSPEASRRAKETFSGMVERDWNHPSIFCWSLVNENWGTDLVNNREHRAWLAKFYQEAKMIDPTRLIVDNSACFNNLHVMSDLDDVHDYRAIPDHAAQWDDFVNHFANRLEWSWADEYLQNRHEELPLILSEFGNWGLPDPRQIQEKGQDPWWFETGYNWGNGIVYPHGMIQRFAEYGLKPVFGSFERFIKDSQEHMARSLAYEISSMRLQPNIGGYVITELTDVHWECNGLMTMQRKIKQGLDRYFVPLNQDRVVVLRPQRWSGRPGEELPVEVGCFSIKGPRSVGSVRWQAGAESGEVAAPGGVIQVRLPDVPKSGMVTLKAQWLDDDGKQLAENLVELACVQPVESAAAVYVHGDTELSAAFKGLGYRLLDHPEENGIIVARIFTEELRSRVLDGAHLLVLAGPESMAADDAAWLPFTAIVQRQGTDWQGDWATSFSWLRKEGPFASLPGSPMLEMEYAEIMPEAVLVGLPAWAIEGHSWAGLGLGWIHKVVSLLATMPYGKGTITATTFQLNPKTLAQNAVAQNLLAGVVELARK